MRTTFSTQVYCRPSKADRNGLSPLEMSIIVNQKRVFLQLPYRAKASEFNRKRRPKEMTEYVQAMQANVNAALCEMAKFGVPVTAANLKQVIKSGGIRAYCVEDLFEDFLRMVKGRIGIDLTQGAYRKYELVRDLFYSRVPKETDVTAVTNATIQEYYIWLQGKYNPTTAASYIAKTKTAFTYAIDAGKVKTNPFAGLKVHHPRKVIDYLTDAELEAIRAVQLDNESLSAVRDSFLLQCYSGLSYIDLEHLREEDIQIAENGVHFVKKDRVKTGVTYTSVILPEGVEVLMRNGYKMKVISNQKMNLYLKQIMTLSGVQHNLTTHLGRKTYGHILLNRGVRMESVAKCLGHSSARTTAKYYAELTSESVINEVVERF